jgi:hypothetical protein
MQFVRSLVKFIFGLIAGFVLVQLLDSACTGLGIRGEVTDVTVGYGVSAHYEHDFRAACVQLLAVPVVVLVLAVSRRQLSIAPAFFTGCMLIASLWSIGIAVSVYRPTLIAFLAIELVLLIVSAIIFVGKQPSPLNPR